MNIKPVLSLYLATLLAFASGFGQVTFRTGNFQLGLNKKGYVNSFYDPVQKKEYVSLDPQNKNNPLLVLHTQNQAFYPSSMKYNKEKSLISLFYGSNSIRADIAVKEYPTHVSFELLTVQGITPPAVMWGPYSTTITAIVGETIGVVRGNGYALGIQALNMHTMGGILREYYTMDTSEAGHFRESDENRAATLKEGRSELRAYTRDKEGGIRNSKIAFFGCPAGKVIETIGQIELTENLPHPLYNGTWGKVSPLMKENWMVTNISEENIDDIIGFARKVNLTVVHTMSAFETWGHFQLNKRNFPNGLDGLKTCVQKAAKYNIAIGVHCLSNFITTNDSYVTPVPDKRLACDIRTGLVSDLDSVSTTLYIRDTADLGNFVARKETWSSDRRNNLKTVKIDNELIQYESVAPDKPYRLVNCKRGAFGTVPARHGKDTEVGKLWDHGYKVFFPSFEMQKEMAVRLADIINYTGVKEISFDGLEGCFFSGLNMYASVQFVRDCVEHFDHEVFCDASIINHNLWHYFSRMSWGDENYQSATRVGDLKFKNQAFYARNYIPPMMGADLKLTTRTRNRLASAVDDAEWQLSKHAGYDAGGGIDISTRTMKNLGNLNDIIRVWNDWEKARALNVFSREQKVRLADPAGEWHLEAVGEKQWTLSPVKFYEFNYEPGSSGPASFKFTNSYDAQNLQFTILVTGKSVEPQVTVKNPAIRLNDRVLDFPADLHQNEYLVYAGGDKGLIYDENWNLIREVNARYTILPEVKPGEQVLYFNAVSDRDAGVSLRIRTHGNQELIKAN